MDEVCYEQVEYGGATLYKIHSNQIKITLFTKIIQQLSPIGESSNIKNRKNRVTNINTAIDVVVSNLLLEINELTDEQNNCICYFDTMWNKQCYLISKFTGDVYFTWARFADRYYNENTLLEGQLMTEVFYPSVSRSMDIEDMYLPPCPPEMYIIREKERKEREDALRAEEAALEDADSEDCTTTSSGNVSEIEAESDLFNEPESKKAKIEEVEIVEKVEKKPLLAREDFLKNKLVDERERTVKNVFNIRVIHKLADENVGGDYTKLVDLMNETLHDSKNFIQDYELSGVFFRYDYQNPVYSTKPLKLEKSHPKTMLYKPLPFIFLNGKGGKTSGVERRLKYNPLLKGRFDWNTTKNFKIEYFGPKKPGVFILKAIDQYGKLYEIGHAYTPNIECQQYVICLLKKIGYQKPIIMRCIYDTKTDNWVPIKYLDNLKYPERINR